MLSGNDLLRFIELLSKFTKIPQKDLKAFIEDGNDVPLLLKRPQAFTLNADFLKKLADINELRQLMKVGLDVAKEQISSPQSVYNHLIKYADKVDKEYFLAMFLDTKNNIIKTEEINIGTHNASLVSVKDLAKKAVMYDCANVIVAHNHPSGSPQPSKEDVILTHKVHSALSVVDVKLLDHIILGENTYLSLKERNYMDNMKSIQEILYENNGVYRVSLKDVIQGIENYSINEIESLVKEFAKEKLHDLGYEDVEIVGVKLYGSRTTGLAHDGSDLDVLLEFKGNIREDVLFNLLNEEPLEIDGITLDINPITEGKSGTIEQFLQIDRTTYNIKSHVVGIYSKEFPAIKYIKEETAQLIANMNSNRDTPLSIKEIRQAYMDVGKRLESIQDDTVVHEFKALQKIVDDLKNAQLTEKQIEARVQVKEETQIVKVNIIER